MGTDEFQTLHLYENPPHASANSNFILTLIQCVLAFKYILLKLGLFYSAFSIDTWQYLFRVSLALAYDLRGRSGRQTRVIACMGEGYKTFSHNALVRLANLNIVTKISVTKM